MNEIVGFHFCIYLIVGSIVMINLNYAKEDTSKDTFLNLISFHKTQLILTKICSTISFLPVSSYFRNKGRDEFMTVTFYREEM